MIRLAKRYPQYKVGPTPTATCSAESGWLDDLLCCACLQIVVLDKLDYCASVNNLESVIDQPNVKVRGNAGAVRRWCRRLKASPGLAWCGQLAFIIQFASQQC